MVQTSVTACECLQGCPTHFCMFLHVSAPFLDHLEWIWDDGIAGCIAAVLLLVALGQRTWSGVLTVPG